MFYKLIKKQGSHTKLLAVKDMEKKGGGSFERNATINQFLSCPNNTENTYLSTNRILKLILKFATLVKQHKFTSTDSQAKALS